MSDAEYSVEELEKTILEQERKIDALKDEVARKNKALLEVMTENRLLVAELGGGKAPAPPEPEKRDAWLERWRQSKRPKP